MVIYLIINIFRRRSHEIGSAAAKDSGDQKNTHARGCAVNKQPQEGQINMKQKITVAAMLSGGAHAQSGVTIFGVTTGILHQFQTGSPRRSGTSYYLVPFGVAASYSLMASTLMCSVTASLIKGT